MSESHPAQYRDPEIETLLSIIDQLNQQDGAPRGYLLRRLIIAGYWFYSLVQEFIAAHGRLALAGDNESGKSTAETAAFPIALTGKTLSSLLDASGKKGKTIEYYVLGAEHSLGHPRYAERTSYIALEFEWNDPDNPPIAPEAQARWLAGERENTRFLTLGTCLHGRSLPQADVDPFFFLITDGNRLVDDFPLVITADDGHPCLQPRTHFKRWVKTHGIVCQRERDYQKEVATHLFGFAHVDQFQSLIRLLLQLRTPHLGETAELADVTHYLKISLPPIPDRIPHHFMETINRLEQHRAPIQELQTQLSSARELHALQYQAIFNTTKYAALGYLFAHDELQAAHTMLKHLYAQQTSFEQQQLQGERQKELLWHRLQEIEGALQALQQHTPSDQEAQLENVHKSYEHLKEQTKRSAALLVEGSQHLEEIQLQIAHATASYGEKREQALVLFQEMEQQAQTVLFWEQSALQLHEGTLLLQTTPITHSQAISSLKQTRGLADIHTGERLTWLSHLANLHQQWQQTAQLIKQSQEQELDCQRTIDTEQTSFIQLQESCNEALTEVDTLIEQICALRPEGDSPSLQQNLASPGPLLSPTDPAENDMLLLHYREQLAAYDHQLITLHTDLIDMQAHDEAQIQQLQNQFIAISLHLETLSQEKRDKESQSEYHPPLAPHRQYARQLLQQHAIPAQPLYALVDFTAPLDRASEQAGYIEQLLADAGLLDALVIHPDHLPLVETLFVEQGLRDCHFHLECGSPPHPSLPAPEENWLLDHLCFDQNNHDSMGTPTDWKQLIPLLLQTASQTLARVSHTSSRTTPSSPTTNGTWRYGLLYGYTNTEGKACCIGRATRVQKRQAELLHLEQQCQSLQQQLATIQQQLEQQQGHAKVCRDYEHQLSRSSFTQAQAIFWDMQKTEQRLQNTWQQYEAIRERTQDARQKQTQVMNELESACQGILSFVRDVHQVEQAIQVLQHWDHQLSHTRACLEEALRSCSEYQQAQTMLERQQKHQQEFAIQHRKLLDDFQQKEALLRELQTLQSHQQGSHIHRTEELLAQKKTASQEHTTLHEQSILLTAQLSSTQQHLTTQEQHVQHQEEVYHQQQEQFLYLLTIYPGDIFRDCLDLVEQGKPLEAAHHLFDPLPSPEEGARWSEQIRKEQENSINAFLNTWLHHAPHLQSYEPHTHQHDNLPLISFTPMQHCLLADLVHILGENLEKQQMILNDEEKTLFEHFFIEETAETLRAFIAQAHTWIHRMNHSLAQMIFGGKHFVIKWEPLPPQNPPKPGSQFAQHIDLLTLGPQLLTEPQKETLFHAFRQEISQARDHSAHQKKNIPFEEILQTMFDYREWFAFHLWVKLPNGKSLPVTQEYIYSQSDAAKLFSFCIPLFAALSALYDTAAPGAPRLFFLDEAFSVASQKNMRAMIEFLADHQFQWIMASSHLSLARTRVPTYVRYWLKRSLEKPLATASPRLWQYGHPPIEEGPIKEQEGK
jgi:Putative exonuclease SbcCD, C subunit